MHLSNMHFFYDAQGKPCQVNRGGTIYNYVLNLQGDVVGLTDASGNLVVEYKYDAWGKLLGIAGSLATSLGTANPLRYRGYVYDTETGLYYLHSRYYNPETRRFISADILFGKERLVLSHNIYAYCTNNPIINADYNGLWTKSIGLTFTGTAGLIFSQGGGICWDDDGNIGMYFTGNLVSALSRGEILNAYIGTFGVSAAVAYSYTTDDNILCLEGQGASMGTSVSIPDTIFSLGGDLILDSEFIAECENIKGHQISLSIGFNADIIDVHMRSQETVVAVLHGPIVDELLGKYWSAIASHRAGSRTPYSSFEMTR